MLQLKKSKCYKLYNIEFIHVNHDVNKIITQAKFSEARRILFASAILAVDDLEKENRNTNLIAYSEIDDAQEYYESQQNR